MKKVGFQGHWEEEPKKEFKRFVFRKEVSNPWENLNILFIILKI